MQKLWKRSCVVAAAVASMTLTLHSAQADPLYYKTRPGSSPPSASAARNAGGPVQSYRSYSYSPSAPSTTRSYSFAPRSSTTRSYSYAPSAPQTMRSYSYAPGTTAPQSGTPAPSNRCYCYPR